MNKKQWWKGRIHYIGVTTGIFVCRVRDKGASNRHNDKQSPAIDGRSTPVDAGAGRRWPAEVLSINTIIDENRKVAFAGRMVDRSDDLRELLLQGCHELASVK